VNPVFSLDEAVGALDPPGGRKGAIERLKHHLRTGRLRLVTRGIYAVVPPGVAVERFQPDPILVAAAVRPDGIFSYHSALELLGSAHSVWRECTMFTDRRRRAVFVGATRIRFLGHPEPLRTTDLVDLGVRSMERQGRMLKVTGPERCLVEGFRRPGPAGGLEELVVSASGFPVLELDLLEEVLKRYDTANLWAAVGWFLERFKQSFHVPPSLLARMEQNRPRAPQYVIRDQRGGELVARWNLIIPSDLMQLGGPDEGE
jgi:predicted transcriptional regulator of viral defense system